MPATEQPTEDEIREALESIEGTAAALPYDRLAQVLWYLARRGAQRMAADEGSTHWRGCWRTHHECAVALVEEAARLLRDASPRDVAYAWMWWNDRDALLARIAPETETDDGE